MKTALTLLWTFGIAALFSACLTVVQLRKALATPKLRMSPRSRRLCWGVVAWDAAVAAVVLGVVVLIPGDWPPTNPLTGFAVAGMLFPLLRSDWAQIKINNLTFQPAVGFFEVREHLADQLADEVAEWKDERITRLADQLAASDCRPKDVAKKVIGAAQRNDRMAQEDRQRLSGLARGALKRSSREAQLFRLVELMNIYGCEAVIRYYERLPAQHPGLNQQAIERES